MAEFIEVVPGVWINTSRIFGFNQLSVTIDEDVWLLSETTLDFQKWVGNQKRLVRLNG